MRRMEMGLAPGPVVGTAAAEAGAAASVWWQRRRRDIQGRRTRQRGATGTLTAAGAATPGRRMPISCRRRRVRCNWHKLCQFDAPPLPHIRAGEWNLKIKRGFLGDTDGSR
jgi:hypothetical protein